MQQNLVTKTGGGGPHRIPRRRLWDVIKMDLKEAGWKSVDCIHLAH
jgi:hypothetical protein